MTRSDEYGPARKLAEAEGWVMAQREGCRPFVIEATKWRRMRKVG